MKVKANGKTFTFPEGTSHEDISSALDEYFAQNPMQEQEAPEAPVAPVEQPEPQPNPSLYLNTYDNTEGDTEAPTEAPKPSRRERMRRKKQDSAIDEYDVGYTVDESKTWEENLASEGFLSLPPVDKRRIADEYFDKHFAPHIDPSQLEAERARFKRASGLGELVNQEEEAKDSRSFLDKAGEYWDKTSLKDMGYDLGNTITRMGEAVGKGYDYLTETPGTKIAVDALSTGKRIGESLLDTAKDLKEYNDQVVTTVGQELANKLGLDVDFGVTDEEFIQRYGVSKAEYTDEIGSVERFQLKRKMDELDRNNINKALNREGVAEDIDVSKVRTEANQKASDVVAESVIDVASMIPAVRMARTGVAASRLTKLGTVATDTAAVGAGEIAKNVYHGRPLDENVLASMAINTGISAPLALRSPTNQATKAVESTVEGRKTFENTMKDLGKAEKFYDRKSEILSGSRVMDDKAFSLIEDTASRKALNDAATLVPRKYDDAARKNLSYTEKGRGELRKQDMWEQMQTRELTEELNKLYKKDVSKSDFVDAAMKKSKELQKGLDVADTYTPNKAGFEAFYDLKKGVYDETFDVTRNRLRTDASKKLSGSGDVDNYLRALEFEALGEAGGVRGAIGRAATGVAGSEGLNKLQRGVGSLAELTSFGVGPAIRERARKTAGERMSTSAQGVISDALEKSRAQAAYEPTYFRELSDTAEKVKDLKSIDEFNALMEADPAFRKNLQGYEFIEPDAARFNTPELKEKAQLNFLRMELEEQLAKSQRLSEGPIKSSREVLERVEGKKALKDQDVMDLSDPIYNYAYPLASETLESKNILQRHKPGFAKADTALAEEANKAAATLYREGQRTAAKSSVANLAVSGILYLTPLPSATIQASIQVVNSLLTARQKRGLVGANKILKKHYTPLKNATDDLAYAQKRLDKGQMSQEHFDNVAKKFDEVEKAYLKDVQKVGEGKVVRLLGLIEEAVRLSERIKEEEE